MACSDSTSASEELNLPNVTELASSWKLKAGLCCGALVSEEEGGGGAVGDAQCVCWTGSKRNKERRGAERRPACFQLFEAEDFLHHQCYASLDDLISKMEAIVLTSIPPTYRRLLKVGSSCFLVMPETMAGLPTGRASCFCVNMSLVSLEVFRVHCFGVSSVDAAYSGWKTTTMMFVF